MKDWRGVVLELAIIGAMVATLAMDHSLAPMVIVAFASWGGTIIQRAKFDALSGGPPGSSMPPPSTSQSMQAVRVPFYRPPSPDARAEPQTPPGGTPRAETPRFRFGQACAI